jgi:hypothetical protein
VTSMQRNMHRLDPQPRYLMTRYLMTRYSFISVQPPRLRMVSWLRVLVRGEGGEWERGTEGGELPLQTS